jgi:hypothetical protein
MHLLRRCRKKPPGSGDGLGRMVIEKYYKEPPVSDGEAFFVGMYGSI